MTCTEREAMERCEPCQFVYADIDAQTLPERLAAFGTRYRAVLLPPQRPVAWYDLLRTRPAAEVWSALEYACHLRDVFLVQRDRLYTALVEDRPTFPPMYRDQRVTLGCYNEQDPEDIATQLDMAARLIAQAFRVLTPIQLQRLCVYNFPAPAERPLLWVGQHAVHEGEHHLRDIAEVLASIRATR
jgi:S-DNA-T family DNA segregation ATPase FtsK/SpoIIIE